MNEWNERRKEREVRSKGGKDGEREGMHPGKAEGRYWRNPIVVKPNPIRMK